MSSGEVIGKYRNRVSGAIMTVRDPGYDHLDLLEFGIRVVAKEDYEKGETITVKRMFDEAVIRQLHSDLGEWLDGFEDVSGSADTEVRKEGTVAG